jgi:hypothetical protein
MLEAYKRTAFRDMRPENAARKTRSGYLAQAAVQRMAPLRMDSSTDRRQVIHSNTRKRPKSRAKARSRA